MATGRCNLCGSDNDVQWFPDLFAEKLNLGGWRGEWRCTDCRQLVGKETQAAFAHKRVVAEREERYERGRRPINKLSGIVNAMLWLSFLGGITLPWIAEGRFAVFGWFLVGLFLLVRVWWSKLNRDFPYDVGWSNAHVHIWEDEKYRNRSWWDEAHYKHGSLPWALRSAQRWHRIAFFPLTRILLWPLRRPLLLLFLSGAVLAQLGGNLQTWGGGLIVLSFVVLVLKLVLKLVAG